MRLRAAATAAILLPSFAFPTRSNAQLDAIETENLRLLYFGATESYLVPHAARCFENAIRLQQRLLDYQPGEPVTVLLDDFSDSGNASATAVPRNMLSVQIAPLSFAYEALSANERMNTIMNHELVHIANMDQAAPSDRFFRGLFRGKVMPTKEHPESILYFYLTTPRVAAPRWYLEGMAVFIDTWMAGGIGRAQGAFDEMVFRSMVRDGSQFYDPLGLVSEGTKVDFQMEINSYLYGTRFLTYVARERSPEHLLEWAKRGDGSKGNYASQFKHVFGQPIEELWGDWIEWEREFQEKNLETIREYPITRFEDVTDRALGSVSRGFVDRDAGKVYAAFNYPGVYAHLGAISLADGSIEKLRDIKGPSIYSVTSVAFDPDSKTLFYTTDNYKFRDLVALDVTTGEARVLLEDARIGELVYNRSDRSIWGVRHFNGICTLVRIPYPYEQWNRVHSWAYGQVAYDMDISPDGQLLSAAVGGINGQHELLVLKIDALLGGDVTPVDRVEFGNSIPANFVFSNDGTYLYGTSYLTGVSNVFRYELATHTQRAVSNTDTGFFRPIPMADDQLLVFRFTGAGFVLTRIDPQPLDDVNAITFLGHELIEQHPVLKDWMVGSPAAIPLDDMVTHRGPYRPLRHIGVESLFPVVQGYKDFAAVGLRLNLSDPISLHRASLTASYTPDGDLDADERLHLHGEYHRHDWSARFGLNDADFYDLFGPTKTSRKGYTFGLGYKKILVYDAPRQLEVSVEADYYGGLERLPDYQNVATSFDELLSASAQLEYRDVRRSLGGVDDEKGHRWALVLANQHVDGTSFPSARADFDLGFALPLHHSSIWLRSSAGLSPRDRDDPFANFYFGGFGNNWVDYREAKRYRAFYSFPGVELNEIGGRNYVKGTLEWNLPPVRFRRLGTPGFYVSWLRPAVFANVIATNLDAPSSRATVGSLGSQLDIQSSLLSALDMTLSLGYAVAFEDGASPRDELMFSLKVLR